MQILSKSKNHFLKNFLYNQNKNKSNPKLFFLFTKMINPTQNQNKGKIQLFDIAANLSDEKFQGIYNGKTYHEDDTNEVLQRAEEFGVNKMLFASGTISDLHISYKLSKLSEGYYTTLGIHPCRASVFFLIFFYCFF